MSIIGDMIINEYQKEDILTSLQNFKGIEFTSIKHATYTFRANGIPMVDIKIYKNERCLFSYKEYTYRITFKQKENNRVEFESVKTV